MDAKIFLGISVSVVYSPVYILCDVLRTYVACCMLHVACCRYVYVCMYLCNIILCVCVHVYMCNTCTDDF